VHHRWTGCAPNWDCSRAGRTERPLLSRADRRLCPKEQTILLPSTVTIHCCKQLTSFVCVETVEVVDCLYLRHQSGARQDGRVLVDVVHRQPKHELFLALLWREEST